MRSAIWSGRLDGQRCLLLANVAGVASLAGSENSVAASRFGRWLLRGRLLTGGEGHKSIEWFESKVAPPFKRA